MKGIVFAALITLLVGVGGQKSPEIVKVDLVKFLASRPELKAELQQKIKTDKSIKDEPAVTEPHGKSKKQELKETPNGKSSQISTRKAVILRDRLGIRSKNTNRDKQGAEAPATSQAKKSQTRNRFQNARRPNAAAHNTGIQEQVKEGGLNQRRQLRTPISRKDEEEKEEANVQRNKNVQNARRFPGAI